MRSMRVALPSLRIAPRRSFPSVRASMRVGFFLCPLSSEAEPLELAQIEFVEILFDRILGGWLFVHDGGLAGIGPRGCV